MRFQRKDKIDRTILVISDIHLGAGAYVEGKRNYLEDFHSDRELVDFLQYYSSGDYLEREVELVINGDLFDLLAVPFVRYFDDEFWSEEASLKKLDIILQAHVEVMDALKIFIKGNNKKIVYIIGNHDAEFIFDSLQEHLIKQFPEEHRSKLKIIVNAGKAYLPVETVAIKHGHEYERAHDYIPELSIATDEQGKRYFIPPWGSYYVTRVMNKFKEERPYVNAVRPVRNFLINGIIYDTLFTIRLILANIFYFLMVKFIFIFMQKNSVREIWNHSLQELKIWKDYEDVTRDFFTDHKDIKTLIVGHTHNPAFHAYGDGTIFINTGTWTKMNYLDLGRPSAGLQLTYAQIDVPAKGRAQVVLNRWRGTNNLPFNEFS